MQRNPNRSSGIPTEARSVFAVCSLLSVVRPNQAARPLPGWAQAGALVQFGRGGVHGQKSIDIEPDAVEKLGVIVPVRPPLSLDVLL